MGRVTEAGILELGETIERYTVEEVLGEGGMACVYRVRHTDLGTDYALKVLTMTGSKGLRERILQEGQLQSSLQHPNVVRVFDVFEVHKVPALLMEYIDGPDLETWLWDTKPSLAECLEVFRGVVAGIAVAHAQGSIHRDLKPENVLMARTAAGWIPKISDFGLAKILLDSNDKNWTKTGHTMGTPAFMAPEQIRDAKHVDARADIFSLGCILYELVCRKPAFEGADMLAILNKTTAGEFTPPEQVVPDLPPYVARAIKGCLAVNPVNRTPTCEALIEQLDAGRSQSLPPTPGAAPGQILGAAGLGAVAVAVPLMTLLGALIYLLVSGAWSSAEPDLDPLASDTGSAGLDADLASVDPDPVVESTRPCEGPAGVVLGYTQVRGVFLHKRGQIWSVGKGRNVRQRVPDEGNDWSMGEVVCVLGPGDRVELTLEPVRVKKSGWWIPVVGGAVEPATR